MLLEVLTVAILAGAPSADAGVARPEWLEQFEALRPRKPNLKFDLGELDNLARLSALGPSRLKADLAKLPPQTRYDLARRMILLGAIAPELRPAIDALAAPASRDAVVARYPRVKPLFFAPADADDPPPDPLVALATRVRAAATVVSAELRDTLTDDERRQLATRRGFFMQMPAINDPAALVGAAQELDALADAVLGLGFEKIELALPMGEAGKKLYGDHMTYIDDGHSYHAVQTPYADLARVIDAFALKPNDRVVDLGSGYGRICFYIALTRPGVDCVGYEIVPERVAESVRVARSLGLDRAVFEVRDLTDPALTPIEAGFFFAYDPVNYAVVGKMLTDLESLSKKRQIRLAAVEGRGKFHAMLRKQPWLKRVKSLPTVRWEGVLPPVLIFESVAPPAER
jgi:hypothetical protein